MPASFAGKFRSPSRSLLRAAALLILLPGGCGGGRGGPATGAAIQPLVVRAAPQDRAAFLTWHGLSEGQSVAVSARRAGEPWQPVGAGVGGRRAVRGLENGVRYEFRAEAPGAAGEAEAAPRTRPDSFPGFNPFDARQNLFLSWEAADRWLARNGGPAGLTLRGSPAPAWNPDAPNGLYRLPDGRRLLLFRTPADRFERTAPPLAPALVRATLRSLLWRRGDPFDAPDRFSTDLEPIDVPGVGRVTGSASARAFRVQYHPRLASRVVWFTPRQAAPGRVAVYAEGHGGSGADIGAETVQFLLDRGWQVACIDMPLTGLNAGDAPGFGGHNDFDDLDDGVDSPVGLFLLPVKAVVDRAVREAGTGGSPTLLLAGRSGGGWTAALYAALDPRVAAVVTIAGATPHAQRTAQDPLDVGDYEQYAPHVYEILDYDDILAAAGARAGFHAYSAADPCCFRLAPGDAFARWLEASAPASGKIVRAFVDPAHAEHGLSPAGYAELDAFLTRVSPDAKSQLIPKKNNRL